MALDDYTRGYIDGARFVTEQDLKTWRHAKQLLAEGKLESREQLIAAQIKKDQDILRRGGEIAAHADRDEGDTDGDEAEEEPEED